MRSRAVSLPAVVLAPQPLLAAAELGAALEVREVLESSMRQTRAFRP